MGHFSSWPDAFLHSLFTVVWLIELIMLQSFPAADMNNFHIMALVVTEAFQELYQL